MRILYGVVGEGMGHATRSAVMLRHLQERHAVEVVVSGRAHGYLTRQFPSLKVHEIAGLSMVYRDNKVKKRRTFWDFVKKIPAFAENYEEFARIAESFRPEVVVSDFESFAYYYAKKHDLPVLSIDNMQIINRCDHSGLEIPDELRGDFRMAKTMVKAKLPRCDHYLITTFFFPPVRKKRTSLHPPILRDAVLAAQPSSGDRVVVYQTSDNFRALIPTLQKLPAQFSVYGLLRGADPQPETHGNVTLKPFSDTGFVTELAGCRAVIAGGGYSLMGEAVQLGKPLLSVPLEGQFEQTLNALYLQKLGYGEYHQQLDEARIAAFLFRTPKYAEALAGYPHRADHNKQILAHLDALLGEVAEKGRLV